MSESLSEFGLWCDGVLADLAASSWQVLVRPTVLLVSEEGPCEEWQAQKETSRPFAGGMDGLSRGTRKARCLRWVFQPASNRPVGLRPILSKIGFELGPLQDRAVGSALSKANPGAQCSPTLGVLSLLSIAPSQLLLLRSVVGYWGFTLRNSSYAGAVPKSSQPKNIL